MHAAGGDEKVVVPSTNSSRITSIRPLASLYYIPPQNHRTQKSILLLTAVQFENAAVRSLARSAARPAIKVACMRRVFPLCMSREQSMCVYFHEYRRYKHTHSFIFCAACALSKIMLTASVYDCAQ